MFPGKHLAEDTDASLLRGMISFTTRRSMDGPSSGGPESIRHELRHCVCWDGRRSRLPCDVPPLQGNDSAASAPEQKSDLCCHPGQGQRDKPDTDSFLHRSDRRLRGREPRRQRPSLSGDLHPDLLRRRWNEEIAVTRSDMAHGRNRTKSEHERKPHSACLENVSLHRDPCDGSVLSAYRLWHAYTLHVLDHAASSRSGSFPAR